MVMINGSFHHIIMDNPHKIIMIIWWTYDEHDNGNDNHDETDNDNDDYKTGGFWRSLFSGKPSGVS